MRKYRAHTRCGRFRKICIAILYEARLVRTSRQTMTELRLGGQTSRSNGKFLKKRVRSNPPLCLSWNLRTSIRCSNYGELIARLYIHVINLHTTPPNIACRTRNMRKVTSVARYYVNPGDCWRIGNPRIPSEFPGENIYTECSRARSHASFRDGNST